MSLKDNVINFQEKKEERDPHCAGEAFCISCGYEWTVVTPISDEGIIDWFECPSCKTMKGRFKGHCQVEKDDPVWICNCGNDLFYVGIDYIFCPNCGAYIDRDEM